MNAEPAMSTPHPIDPALVAYLGAAMALLKLWHAESQQAADAFKAGAAEAEPTHAPRLEHLEAIRQTTTSLPVPQSCQAVQQAFLAAMDRGLLAYRALLEPGARDEQKVAMLSGMENFAYFDAELARLEQQFGPLELG